MKRATGVACVNPVTVVNFNPRPREEGDKCFIKSILFGTYFNPRPREEGDQPIWWSTQKQERFQSTPSWRGRHRNVGLSYSAGIFQSTPSWRGRLRCWFISISFWVISIHALVKRATICQNISPKTHLNFNPRPREEGDLVVYHTVLLVFLFQSTPSWRGRHKYNRQ